MRTTPITNTTMPMVSRWPPLFDDGPVVGSDVGDTDTDTVGDGVTDTDGPGDGLGGA